MAWPVHPFPTPPLQPLHALSLLSTDGTQVSPGAHCPSPPGTGKSQARGSPWWGVRMEGTQEGRGAEGEGSRVAG